MVRSLASISAYIRSHVDRRELVPQGYPQLSAYRDRPVRPRLQLPRADRAAQGRQRLGHVRDQVRHAFVEQTLPKRANSGFRSLLDNGGFERPRNGKKNDKAHPPIHPTQHVNNLTGDDKRVYDLVVRRFLGCCSKNAKGLETTCEIEIASEAFSAKGA